MKKLLVFYNFIEASERALDQAISLGKKEDAKIVICHIMNESEKDAEILKKLEPQAEKVRMSGLEASVELEQGDIYEAAAKAARRIDPDLVIAGTRGAEGFDMSIFGSAIYKFVRDVAYTSLVLHSASKIAENGYKGIMLPVSPHTNFIKKVRETLKVIADGGLVTIFALIQEGGELDEITQSNIEKTKDYLDDQKIKWQYKEFIIRKNQHDLAKQTLNRIKELEIDLITISADVSARNMHFGKMHKEDMLLNDQSIPVLCVNTDIE
jgi:nucleotide-binding universal stress UspA family protein